MDLPYQKKQDLFDYACLKFENIEEDTMETLHRYVRNLILVINAFFEYGFN